MTKEEKWVLACARWCGASGLSKPTNEGIEHYRRSQRRLVRAAVKLALADRRTAKR